MGLAAGHQYLRTRQIASLCDGMQAHRKRLGTGGLGGRGGVGKCRALFCRNNQPVAEHALFVRQAHGAAHEAHVEAMDRLALQAELAVATGLRGIDGDELADGQSADTRAQNRDMAGCLVTADDRLAHPHRAETAILIIMQIGATDAACRHGQQHFAGAGGRNVLRFDADIFAGI